MFSLGTTHQSSQNGLLSLLVPLSAFSFAPISAVGHFNGVCAHKDIMLPIIAGSCLGCILYGRDGQSVLSVRVCLLVLITRMCHLSQSESELVAFVASVTIAVVWHLSLKRFWVSVSETLCQELQCRSQPPCVVAELLLRLTFARPPRRLLPPPLN